MATPKGYRHTPERIEQIRQANRRRYAERPDITARLIAGAKRPRAEATRRATSARQASDFRWLDCVSPQEWGYIAGLVDGEGCIGIVKRSGRRQCALVLAIAGTCRALHEWLRSRLRGNISGGPRKERPGWRTVYRWSAAQVHAEQVLRRVEPLLIVKRDQARLALEFQAARFGDLETHLALKARMNALNRRARRESEGAHPQPAPSADARP